MLGLGCSGICTWLLMTLMKDEGADVWQMGVRAMPLQFATTYLPPSHLLASLAHSWCHDLVDGTVSKAASQSNFRVSSQPLLGMRRVAVLPQEGFSGLD